MRDETVSAVVFMGSHMSSGVGIFAAYLCGVRETLVPERIFICTAATCITIYATLGILLVRELLRSGPVLLVRERLRSSHRRGGLKIATETPRATLMRPPGSHIHAVLGFVCSRKTMERVFEPAMADMWEEYFKALATKQNGEMRRVVLAYYWSLIKLIPLQAIIAVVKQVFELWKWFGSAV